MRDIFNKKGKWHERALDAKQIINFFCLTIILIANKDVDKKNGYR